MKVKINTNPPGHQPTEEEFRIAYLTYVLQYLCYELLLDMQPQDVKIIENMFCGDEDDEREVWERKFPYEDFRKRYLKYLRSEHHGDCICQAITCTRCLAEELFNIPSTVDWCRCYFYKYDDHKHKGTWIGEIDGKERN